MQAARSQRTGERSEQPTVHSHTGITTRPDCGLDSVLYETNLTLVSLQFMQRFQSSKIVIALVFEAVGFHAKDEISHVCEFFSNLHCSYFFLFLIIFLLV